MSAASARTAVRADLWWGPKVLPVIAAASLAALAADTPPPAGVVRIAAMVVSAGGLAAAAHLVNDWADIGADAAAAKPNVVASWSTVQRLVALVACFAIGALPWALVPPQRTTALLLLALVVLPVLYSAPPLRLKGRGLLGVLADALNVHVVPTAFAFELLGEAGDRTDLWRWSMGGALLWAAGFGVRSILTHQRRDLAADQVAGVGTFVARHGQPPTERLGRGAFVVELAGLLVVLASSVRVAPAVVLGFALYLGLWWRARRDELGPIRPIPHRPGDWMPLTEFYVVWPALAYGTALGVRDARWWPLPLAVALIFHRDVAKQARDLAPWVREPAIEIGVVGRKVLRWIAEVAPRQWWRIRSALRWVGWRIRNLAAWIFWRLESVVRWLGWRVRNAASWFWWHPLAFVRDQLVPRGLALIRRSRRAPRSGGHT